jgi:hypothetical protein
MPEKDYVVVAMMMGDYFLMMCLGKRCRLLFIQLCEVFYFDYRILIGLRFVFNLLSMPSASRGQG